MVTKNMVILDLVNKHPETIPVLSDYDRKFSTCICCSSLFETLEKAAKKHRLNLEKLLADLNEVLSTNKDNQQEVK